MDVVECRIELLKSRDLSEVSAALRTYVSSSDDVNPKLVARRFLHELANIDQYPSMFILGAYNDAGLIGITNGAVDGEIGLLYHTIVFTPRRKIGSLLFERKIEHLFRSVNIIAAKPESNPGLQLTLKYRFERAPTLDYLLYWKGKAYSLDRLKYTPLVGSGS